MRRREGIVSAIALLLMFGCAKDNDEPIAAASRTEESRTSLRDTCPKVRTDLPASMQPFSRWRAFSDTLNQLSSAGDTEVKDALELLTNAVDVLAAGPPAGQKALNAERTFIIELDHLAQSCSEAGSDALRP